MTNPDFESPESPGRALEEFEEHNKGGGSAGFTLIVVTALVLAGGIVYVLGAAGRAADDTEAAVVSASDQLEQFDPEEFTSEFVPGTDSTPPSLPFAGDDDTPTTSASPPTSAPAADPIDDGRHPGVDVDPSSVAVAFVNRIPGDDYGKAAWIDLDGERHQTGLVCERLDLKPNRGLCLSNGRGLGAGEGLITDGALVPSRSFGLSKPSRAAVSPDGSIVAFTGFTLGHSYAEPGQFSTLSQVISIERLIAANLETAFSTFVDGEPLVLAELNFWGITFVDNDRFYATVGTPDGTSIAEGRISNARIDVRFENATCPEVSPDGSTIVAKEVRDGHNQMIAVDAETGDRRDLGETRSVEDQVEFLDDDTVVYGMPNNEEGTSGQPAWDIWALDLAPGSTPRLLVPFADSPAVPST
ncbi:MAG: hypothetical protein ACR2P0_06750 [Acidimicrobiales bacterium]